MNPETVPPIPHTPIGRAWRRWAGSIAFVLLVLLGVAGFYKVEINRYDACAAGNLLRLALIAVEEERIATTEATDPDLFPDIPPKRFEELVDESVEESEDRIENRYAPRDCGTVWPFRP